MKNEKLINLELFKEVLQELIKKHEVDQNQITCSVFAFHLYTYLGDIGYLATVKDATLLLDHLRENIDLYCHAMSKEKGVHAPKCLLSLQTRSEMIEKLAKRIYQQIPVYYSQDFEPIVWPIVKEQKVIKELEAVA